MKYYEANFDGLVGPNHNYAGLAEGNLASAQNSQTPSYPAEAALQGLEKMKLLHDSGLKQAVLPPHERPCLDLLRNFGYSGNESQIIQKSFKGRPHLLAAAYSASSMWTANCATICPSTDSQDGKLHLTPANLVSNLHRSAEAAQSEKILKTIFVNPDLFKVHPPLASGSDYADEGAANHIRFCPNHSKPGLQLFVYGKNNSNRKTSKFNPRQSKSASELIINLHQIREKQAITVQQNSQAIDAGVFHNDVISTGNENFFMAHQLAFENQKNFLGKLKKKYSEVCSDELKVFEIPNSILSLEDAIKSYIFNTQIVTLPDSSMMMIAPTECSEMNSAGEVIKQLLNGHSPISEVKYLDLRQSMKNGGGPACLRLRITMNDEEFKSLHQGVILTNELYEKLKQWIKKHYREMIVPADLEDPGLPEEIRFALDELTQILKLGSIYQFQ